MLPNGGWFFHLEKLASSWLVEYSPPPLEEVHAVQEGPICPNDLNSDILPSLQCLKIGDFPKHDRILTEFHRTFYRVGCREHRIVARNLQSRGQIPGLASRLEPARSFPRSWNMCRTYCKRWWLVDRWCGQEDGVQKFFALKWYFHWNGQHPPAGGSELESETYRGAGTGITYRSGCFSYTCAFYFISPRIFNLLTHFFYPDAIFYTFFICLRCFLFTYTFFIFLHIRRIHSEPYFARI